MRLRGESRLVKALLSESLFEESFFTVSLLVKSLLEKLPVMESLLVGST